MSARPSSTIEPAAASHAAATRTPKAAAASARAPRKVGLYAVLIAVVVILGIVAVVVSRNGGTKTTAFELGMVTVAGTPLPALPDGAASDPAAGMAAPAITGTTFDGKAETITPGAGPMLVMFVAHWCPHCQREVPLVTSWLKASVIPTDVTLRAVATATSSTLPNYPPSAWLAKAKFPITTIADDEANAAAAAYGLTSYPYFVALDKTGKVVTRASGELTQAQFEGLITAARTGRAAAA